MRYGKVSIKVILLVVFSATLLASVVITNNVQYYFASKSVDRELRSFLQQTSGYIHSEISEIGRQSQNTIQVVELLDDINYGFELNELHPFIRKSALFIDSSPQVYAIYLGYDNGNFLEIINLDSHPTLRPEYDSTLEERWLVVKIIRRDGESIRTNEFLDKNYNLLRTSQYATTYNPVERPWYKQAQGAGAIIRTEPYKYSHFDTFGVTYAKELPGKGITVGVDISTKTLSDYFDKQIKVPGSQLFLYDKGINSVLASNMAGDNDELTNRLLNDSKREVEIDGRTYILLKSGDIGFQQRLLVLAPKEELYKEFYTAGKISIFINTLFIALLFPLLMYLVGLMVKPITQLTANVFQIKRREYAQVKPVSSFITELDVLSEGVTSMSASIEHHNKEIEKLVDSFVELIASAIDAKSSYTGGHCRKVPVIMNMLVEAAIRQKDGIFKEFSDLSYEQRREINIAGNLHDCGKIAMPESVIDKSVKLETKHNRIHEIRTRFEVVYRDCHIQALEKITAGADEASVFAELAEELQQLQDDFAFVAQCNIGTETMEEDKKQRIRDIANRVWLRNFDDSLGLSESELELYVPSESRQEQLLADKQQHIIPRIDFDREEYERFGFKLEVPEHLYNHGEIYNLCIERGTVNAEERFKIKEHIINTIKMLEALPFPQSLSQVVEFASNHHEALDGTGYPRGLVKEQMSVPSRMLAVADVFEALTAHDRPYKKANSLSEAISLMFDMVDEQQLDQDIFQLFLDEKVYLDYAHIFLHPEQIDMPAIEKLLQERAGSYS